MSELLTNIGTFFASGPGQGLMKVLQLGTAGGGLVGNILNERMRSQELSRLSNAEKTLADPTKLSAEVRAATQPLNEGLVSSVSEPVIAGLAERGLSQAPGIQAAAVSSALAPFEQQNQQTALQLVLARLGLPIEYARTILAGLPPNTNLAPIMAMLAGAKGGGTDPSLDPTIAKLIAGSPMTSDTSSYSAPTTLTPPPGYGGDTGDFQLPADIWG